MQEYSLARRPRFQSTLPCGSDVSILNISMDFLNFNPRSLAGATGWGTDNTPAKPFQSTLPCGSDQQRLLLLQEEPNFNPRSLAGATKSYFAAVAYRYYFNPRSLAGATSASSPSTMKSRNFNPRSIAGATMGSFLKNLRRNFNPRSLAGATFCLQPAPAYPMPFQSTLPCGSDKGFRQIFAYSSDFNPRSLAGATITY